MAVKRNGTAVKYLLLHNGVKLKKGYHNGTKEIWSAGSTVTYIVDTNKSYTEEVDYGATCLAPTTFTPAKSGWTFVGWREDTTANGNVLTSKVMESNEITLYAVYKKTVRLTVVIDSNSTPYAGTAFCNASGSTVNPTFTVADPTKSDYIFTGWSNTADGEIEYFGISGLTLSADKTVYALFVSAVQIYSYTGSIQEYLAPATGSYKLEVYGAQGGSHIDRSDGGKGGYSTGMIILNKGEKLYIGVGGAGLNHQSLDANTAKTLAGGYNGGGNGAATGRWEDSIWWTTGGSGGGATHIAKGDTNRGVLANYESYTSEVVIVAGGGGGAIKGHGWEDDGTPRHDYSAGGTGGGTSGGLGEGSNSSYGGPGTQTSGGAGGYGDAGIFGKGGNSNTGNWSGAGGGGGYYGGGGTHGNYGAGGGSGFIGGVINGTTTNGQRSGNGSATITFLTAASSFTVTYIIDGTTYTEDVPIGTDCLNPKSFTIPTKSGYAFAGWSYTENGTVLTECTAVTSTIVLYGVYKHVHTDACYRTVTKESLRHLPDATDTYCPGCGQYYADHYYICDICGNVGFGARTSNCTCGQTPTMSADFHCYHEVTETICGFD